MWIPPYVNRARASGSPPATVAATASKAEGVIENKDSTDVEYSSLSSSSF
jgi:hypothetical protein